MIAGGGVEPPTHGLTGEVSVSYTTALNLNCETDKIHNSIYISCLPIPPPPDWSDGQDLNLHYLKVNSSQSEVSVMCNAVCVPFVGTIIL